MAVKTYSYGPTNVDDWLAASAKNYLDMGKAHDNVYNYMALIAWLKGQGRTKVLSGGAEVVHQVWHAKMGGGAWYTGAEQLATQGTETLTEVGWVWRNIAVPIVITGNEKRANKSNETQLLNLLQERTENAVMRERDILATALASSAQVTNQVDALLTIISASATTGGVAGTGNSWWQATVTTSGSFASQGLTDMMTNYLTVSQGSSAPKLIYSGKTEWSYYWQALQPQQRYVDTKMADAGFENLKFMGATWIADTFAPTGDIYLINPEAYRFSAMEGANVDLNEEVRPANQDAFVRQVLLQCATSTPNRRLNGLVDAVTA
jgi:hypothetical protein